MATWVRSDGVWEWTEFEPPPAPQLDVTENPVVAELLGPDGEVIRQWCERPPIGFRRDH